MANALADGEPCSRLAGVYRGFWLQQRGQRGNLHPVCQAHFAACDILNVPINPARGFTMPAAQPRRSLDELARLGGQIFERQVRTALRPEDDGKFVAIDVETGDFEIDDDDDTTAVARMRLRKPAADVWLMRAGCPTTYRIGAAL